MTNGKETATNTVPHEGEKTETIEPKKIQNTAVAKPTPHTPVEPPHLSSVTNFPEGIKIKKVAGEKNSPATLSLMNKGNFLFNYSHYYLI